MWVFTVPRWTKPYKITLLLFGISHQNNLQWKWLAQYFWTYHFLLYESWKLFSPCLNSYGTKCNEKITSQIMPFACAESLPILEKTQQTQTWALSLKITNIQAPTRVGATQRFVLTVSDLDFQMKGQTARLYSMETHLGGSRTLATYQNLLAPRTFKIISLPKRERSLCDHSP